MTLPRQVAALTFLILGGCSSGREGSADGEPARKITVQRVRAEESRRRIEREWSVGADGMDVRVRVTDNAGNAADSMGTRLAPPGGAGGSPLRSVEPHFLAGGAEGRLQVLTGGPWTLGGRRGLRVSGIVRFPTHVAQWERIVTLGDVPGTMDFFTALWSERPPESVALIERLRWKGTPQAPGADAMDSPGERRAPWIGAELPESATVLSGGEGTTIAPVFETHGPHQFLMHVDAMPEGIRRGRIKRWRTRIATTEGSLADAVRHLGWARGRPFPEVWVTAPRRPSQFSVTALDAKGQPWITTRIHGPGPGAVPVPRDQPQVTLAARAFGHIVGTPKVVRMAGARTVRIDLPRTGILSVRVFDKATGAPLPARLRVLPEGTTHPFSLGPDFSADGAGDAAYALDGIFKIPVPLGKYSVLASHGPLWTTATRSIVVTGRDQPEGVDLGLQAAIDPGRWVAADFHLHASPSPSSQVPLSDRVIALTAEDIRFAVPTDHNHITDYGPSIRAAGLELDSVPGVEVTTGDPIFGHFNGFPILPVEGSPGNGAPASSGRSPDELFAELHGRHPLALVQVNHPRLEGGIGYFDQMDFDAKTGRGAPAYSPSYDLIEVWNGFDLARPAKVQRNFAEWLALLARSHPVVATGNSDSHTVRTQWSGYPRTYVYVDPATALAVEDSLLEMANGLGPDGGLAPVGLDGGGPDGGTPSPLVTEFAVGLLDALRAGRAFVTNGPFLQVTLAGRGPGSHIPVGPKKGRLIIDVQTPSWMSVDTAEVYLGEQRIAELALVPKKRGHRLQVRREFSIPLGRPTFVVVLVRGAVAMDSHFGKKGVYPMAFTNPIWIVADPT
ncbi:MAG: PHP domain-containing protein [Myxococcales bacterium]|nr:PHP domain-containing protein [Myxococcales bacterium]